MNWVRDIFIKRHLTTTVAVGSPCFESSDMERPASRSGASATFDGEPMAWVEPPFQL